VGSVVWFRRQDRLDEPDDDRAFLFREGKVIDGLLDHLGVLKVTSFFDWSEVKASLDDAKDQAWVRANERWHPAPDLEKSLAVLLAVLEKGPPPRGPANPKAEETRQRLLPEIRACLRKAQEAARDGVPVHLAVIP
jgi:hypothetical protein